MPTKGYRPHCQLPSGRETTAAVAQRTTATPHCVPSSESLAPWILDPASSPPRRRAPARRLVNARRSLPPPSQSRTSPLAATSVAWPTRSALPSRRNRSFRQFLPLQAPDESSRSQSPLQGFLLPFALLALVFPLASVAPDDLLSHLASAVKLPGRPAMKEPCIPAASP